MRRRLPATGHRGPGKTRLRHRDFLFRPGRQVAIPRDALIFVRRAGAWFGKHEFAKAVEDLTTSIGIKDNDADRVTRGLAYREMGNLDKAVADFAEAIRLNPQNAAALAYRGDRLHGEVRRAAGTPATSTGPRPT